MSSFNYEKALSLDWNGQLFVLTIRGETPLKYNYMYSYDGTTWSTSTDLSNSSLLVNKNPYNIKWTGSNYTMMGDLTNTAGNTLLTSKDGIKYSALSTTNLSGPTYDLETNLEFPHTITFPRNTTLALGGSQSDTTKIAYSIDEGITWIPSSNSATVFTTTANNAVWNGITWVAVGAGGNTIATSIDGNTWVGRGSYIFTTAGYGIAWSKEQTQWVACGTGLNSLAYSPDGVYWTGVGNTLLSTAYDVQWNGIIWVATGVPISNNKSIIYSYDGRSWYQPTQTNLFDVSGIKLSWNGSLWTAIGRSSSNNNYYNLATSVDGIIWATYNNPNISSTSLTNIYTNKNTGKTLITSNGSPPLPPTGLTVSGSTINSITYTFTASSGATSYTAIVVDTSGNVITKTGITGSPYTITGLQSNTLYTITTVAINIFGTSVASGPLNASTILASPTLLTVVSNTSTSITFSFTPPSGAITSFTATAVPTSGTTITLTGISGSATSATITGLQNGMQYTITLVAININGSSAPSTGLIYQTVLAPPTGLTVSSTTATTIVYTFTPPTNGTVSSYTANLVDQSGNNTQFTGITASPATITGLQTNIQYTITMVAINTYGTSASSSPGLTATPTSLVTGYTFRIKGTTATVPTTDTTGNYTITNTSSVTMINNATRGYVFNFSGSNFLQVTANSPVNSTKTFWVSSTTPSTSSGNVFSSTNYPVFFNLSTYLNFSPNFSNGSGSRYISTTTQTATWIFYAITTTSTTTTMYINGSSTANVSGTITNGWAGETSIAIQFGAYLSANYYTGYIDDMRLYPSVLTTAQMLQIYNGA